MPLGNDLAHLRHRNQIAGDGRGGEVGRGDGDGTGTDDAAGAGALAVWGFSRNAMNVLLRNTTAHAGAGDLRKIYVMLTRDLADQRGRARVIVGFFAASQPGLSTPPEQ